MADIVTLPGGGQVTVTVGSVAAAALAAEVHLLSGHYFPNYNELSPGATGTPDQFNYYVDTVSGSSPTVLSGSAGIQGLVENGTGSDTLVGTDATTFLTGNDAGDEFQVNGSGFVIGGNGNDTVLVQGSGDSVSLYDGTGNDVVSVTGSNDTLYALSSVAITLGTGASTVYGSVTNIDGKLAASGDTVTATTGNTFIASGDNLGDMLITGGTTGSDSIWGSGGDSIYGGGASDSIDGVAGDSIFGGTGAQFLEGVDSGIGNQYIVGGSDGVETIWGGSGDTILGGSGGSETVFGVAGDTITGGSGGTELLEGVSNGVGNQYLQGGTAGDRKSVV